MAVATIIDPTTGRVADRYLKDLAYGSFSCLESQTIEGINIPTALFYDTTEIAHKCSIFDESIILVEEAGIYKFSYSVQLDKSGGGTEHCDIFLKINGTPLARSASRVTVAGTAGESFPHCEYILQLDAGDEIQVVFTSADATMTATYFPATGTHPEIPSIISNIIQIA
jgi:hypothetical protein